MALYNSGIRIDESVDGFYSGTSLISANEIKFIDLYYQSITFTVLTLDGCLMLEGDLWLA